MDFPHFKNNTHRIAYLSGTVKGMDSKDFAGISIINNRIAHIKNDTAPENDADLEGVTTAEWKERSIALDTYFLGMFLFILCVCIAQITLLWVYEFGTMNFMNQMGLSLAIVIVVGAVTTSLSQGFRHYRLKQFRQSSPGALKHHLKKAELEQTRFPLRRLLTT